MNCQDAVLQLQDYLKREMTPALALQLREHLEQCRPCLEHAEFERNFLALVESRMRGECCPERLRQQILAALKANSDPGPG